MKHSLLRWTFFLSFVLIGTGKFASPANVQAADRTANAKIAVTEVMLSDVRIRPSGFDGYEFTGRIRNTSRKNTLQGVAIRIVFYDCTKRSNDSTCELIGERRETIYTSIPPGEERAFNEPVYIYGDVLKVRGNLVWRYNVLSTKSIQGK